MISFNDATDNRHKRCLYISVNLGYKTKTMFGKLNTPEIDQLISQQLVGRIGCHADGITYIVPISYVYDGTYIYAHSFNGMKMDMLRKNPKVCFQVDNTKNLANWQSVVCWGEFEEIHNEQQKADALQKLSDRTLPILSSETMHITPEWPFPASKDEMIKGIFFRIQLTEKTGRYEKAADEFFFAT
jgi:nitroimidazol reductase NimA-like FMN-containing flavoprotein (pyridoxamine 5'-phosphate oxidase superfamily)